MGNTFFIAVDEYIFVLNISNSARSCYFIVCLSIDSEFGTRSQYVPGSRSTRDGRASIIRSLATIVAISVLAISSERIHMTWPGSLEFTAGKRGTILHPKKMGQDRYMPWCRSSPSPRVVMQLFDQRVVHRERFSHICVATVHGTFLLFQLSRVNWPLDNWRIIPVASFSFCHLAEVKTEPWSALILLEYPA